MNKKLKGFTLMELMIVVAIIGIISAIAYPSYQNYMYKSRRSDAMTALTKIVDLEERYYLQNNTYTTNLANLNMSAVSDQGYYNLTVTASTAGLVAGYTASAKAVSPGPQATDTTTPAGDCTTMTLDSTGVKSPSACWP